MWTLYARPFRRNLTDVFDYDRKTAKAVVKKAKLKYKEILKTIPDFEKGDCFRLNIVSAAMLGAVVLSMKERPSVSVLTRFYEKAMMTGMTKFFCRMSAKIKYTEKDVSRMKKTAVRKAGDRNPYSWNMDFLPYPDGSGYETRFTKCGICHLMNELGLYNLTPALCHFDYAMSEAGGKTDFVRENTLASGGPYCDCGYKKKNRK